MNKYQFFFAVFQMCADLYSADLYRANLDGANLESTNLIGAKLDGANLRGANLNGTYLNDANLKSTDFKDAEFGCVKNDEETIECTNLKNAINLTPEQVKQASNWEKAEYDPQLRKQLGLPPAKAN